MNKKQRSDRTTRYYERNAEAFVRDTSGLDISDLYREFLPLIPTGGKILDAGCGSGRDSVYFKQRGFSVTAFDASSECARIASLAIGQAVEVITFLDVTFIEEFDGIWACAALLHTPQTQMDEALSCLSRSLKVGGVTYVSFKYGQCEGERSGRFFNDFDEAKLAGLLNKHPELSLQKVWRTRDSRLSKRDTRWLNAILKKSA
jgi:SAM-dependent methyltransferase